MQKIPSDYSPSSCHRHVMSALQPTMAFNGGNLRQWQNRLRARLRKLMGDLPASKAHLDSRTLWKRSHPLGKIEKIEFTSEPYCRVPAYVCIPANASPPFPFMICLQGHSSGMHNSIAVNKQNEKHPMEVAGDRDYAIACMRNGMAALCIEQRSLGERRENRQQHTASNSCHDAMMHALMLGRTLLGERVYDVERGIDYLAERGDADMRRIGVMGNSGGGTSSIYAAALSRRINYAMPSCSFCDFRASKMMLYHCACGYLPGILKYAEMADIMGLFAPRPVVIVAGKDDPIIPLPGVRKAFHALKRIYRAAGAPNHCHLVVGNGGHRFYANAAWPIFMPEILDFHFFSSSGGSACGGE